MKLGEKKVLQTITENIEMELFSSEERCVTVTIQRREEDSFEQRFRYLEHPLAPDCEEDLEQHQDQAKPRAEPPVLEGPLHCPHVIDLTEEAEMEMEMESFPPIRLSDIELVEIKSGDPSIVTSPNRNKASCVKWKRVIPKKTGLVVKDVVCLPRAHYMAQLDRQLAPERKDAPQAAMGLTARITIDYSWSAHQMESRLAFLFRGWFVKKTGQRFSFTYLQCVQGSRALFVPDSPAEGWTGEQVLRISGHGDLYVLSHHDYPQVDSASDTSVGNSESIRESDLQLVRHIHPRMGRSPERLTLNLDTVLRLYRQDNVNGDAEICIQARRGDVLHSALKAVRKPGFCFRSTPAVSFTEETKTCKEPIKEFFRLSLLELQQSCVFEGHLGRLFLTYDLTALEDRKYYEAGVLIGWSLAQGGPGPCCLHPVFYQLLCCQSPSMEDFNEMDIVDAETQNRLQELRGCSDVKLLSPGLCDWVSCCGIPRIHSACSDEIPAIYDRLVKHYIYHRVASMISQFIAGLNSCGRLWDLVKSHWEMFLPIMTSTHQQQQPLTLAKFKQLFTVCYSHPDSDLRAAEEATVLHWETILTMVSDCQVDFSLQDLFIFITGAHQLPPLGFLKPLSLCFYSQDETPMDVHLPHVSMSSLELFLPRGVAEVADLLVLMNRALQKAVGLTHLIDDHEMDADFLELKSF